jgi:hypothetical protein
MFSRSLVSLEPWTVDVNVVNFSFSAHFCDILYPSFWFQLWCSLLGWFKSLQISLF